MYIRLKTYTIDSCLVSLLVVSKISRLEDLSSSGQSQSSAGML